MNFNPSDLYGVLPALLLSVGALVLLTSEVFLRAAPEPDRRYQAWLSAAFAAAGLWTITASDRSASRFNIGY